MAQTLSKEEEEREYRRFMEYSRQTGCMFINDIFRIKAPKTKTNNRFLNLNIKAPEAIWGAVFALTILILQLIMRQIITPNNQIARMFWGWQGMLVLPAIGFLLGIAFSRRSPYKKYSGEQATSWFFVNIRMLFNKIFVKFGMMPEVYKPVLSTMVSRSERTEQITYAKVYIGICPADYVTKVANPYDHSINHRIRAVSETKDKKNKKIAKKNK